MNQETECSSKLRSLCCHGRSGGSLFSQYGEMEVVESVVKHVTREWNSKKQKRIFFLEIGKIKGVFKCDSKGKIRG